MTHTPHELHEEFPEFHDQIHALKLSDQHFQRLSDQYHAVNREIHRIESQVENVADEVAEDLKKQRLALKDEIFGLLRGV